MKKLITLFLLIVSLSVYSQKKDTLFLNSGLIYIGNITFFDRNSVSIDTGYLDEVTVFTKDIKRTVIFSETFVNRIKNDVNNKTLNNMKSAGDYLISSSNSFGTAIVFEILSVGILAIPLANSNIAPQENIPLYIISGVCSIVGIGCVISGIVQLNKAGKSLKKNLSITQTNNGVSLIYKF